MINSPSHDFLRDNTVPKPLIVLNVLLTIVYFGVITFIFPPGNRVLYALLILGEVFHVWQLFTYLYTIWNTEYIPPSDVNFKDSVDVFITVAGEPYDVVEETLAGVLAMKYPSFKTYILNDGLVAKKDNWRDMEALAKKYGVTCITRTKPGGAKSGNINNALKQTKSPFVAIFDADHVPHEDFLSSMMPYFADAKMGFVQSPQYYKNAFQNRVTEGAWDQQAIFFGAICKGKNRHNAATMCGTNMVIRREALLAAGGMREDNIAEDFITGLMIHELGWKSYFVPKVLAEGLAPEDFLSYYKQQFRWARGAFDVIKHPILFNRGLTLPQKIEYLSSISFFLSGLIVAMNALIPVVFFFTGLVPLSISTMMIGAAFIPYIILTLYIIARSSNFSFTFRSLAFSMASFAIHIGAVTAAIMGRKTPFAVTSKKKIDGSFLRLVVPHMAYAAIVAGGFAVALSREGLNPSVMTNFAWAILNVAIFSEFILAAKGQSRESEVEAKGKVALKTETHE